MGRIETGLIWTLELAWGMTRDSGTPSNGCTGLHIVHACLFRETAAAFRERISRKMRKQSLLQYEGFRI
jgi:hypothetical protein